MRLMRSRLMHCLQRDDDLTCLHAHQRSPRFEKLSLVSKATDLKGGEQRRVGFAGPPGLLLMNETLRICNVHC